MEGFGDLSAVAVPDVALVDIKVVFEVSLKDLEFSLISAVIGLQDSLLYQWFIQNFIF